MGVLIQITAVSQSGMSNLPEHFNRIQYSIGSNSLSFHGCVFCKNTFTSDPVGCKKYATIGFYCSLLFSKKGISSSQMSLRSFYVFWCPVFKSLEMRNWYCLFYGSFFEYCYVECLLRN